jgi:hypothetical protein
MELLQMLHCPELSVRAMSITTHIHKDQTNPISPSAGPVLPSTSPSLLSYL